MPDNYVIVKYKEVMIAGPRFIGTRMLIWNPTKIEKHDNRIEIQFNERDNMLLGKGQFDMGYQSIYFGEFDDIIYHLEDDSCACIDVSKLV